MTINKSPLLALASLALIASANAFDAKSEIKTVYAQFATVARNNDYPAAEKLWKGVLAQGFIYTQLGGKSTMDGAHLLAGMKQEMAAMKISKVAMRVLSVDVKGTSATVKMSQDFDAVFTGKDKKPHKVHNTSSATDGWVKVGNKWKIKSIKDTSDKTTVDGKPYKTGG